MDLPVVDTGAEKCPRDWPRTFLWSPSSFRPSVPTLSALSSQKTGMNKLCSHPSEPSAQWKRTKSTNYDNLIPLLSVLRKPWCTRVLCFSWVIFPGCGWLKVRLTIISPTPTQESDSWLKEWAPVGPGWAYTGKTRDRTRTYSSQDALSVNDWAKEWWRGEGICYKMLSRNWMEVSCQRPVKVLNLS